jgi:hypothetical protein
VIPLVGLTVGQNLNRELDGVRGWLVGVMAQVDGGGRGAELPWQVVHVVCEYWTIQTPWAVSLHRFCLSSNTPKDEPRNPHRVRRTEVTGVAEYHANPKLCMDLGLASPARAQWLAAMFEPTGSFVSELWTQSFNREASAASGCLVLRPLPGTTRHHGQHHLKRHKQRLSGDTMAIYDPAHFRPHSIQGLICNCGGLPSHHQTGAWRDPSQRSVSMVLYIHALHFSGSYALIARFGATNGHHAHMIRSFELYVGPPCPSCHRFQPISIPPRKQIV